MATDSRQEFRYFIDELKSRTDIVAAIGSHVKLARNGRNFKGLCPFHQEDTPSFLVHPDRNYYHCFGCGAHGDVITFLQRFRHNGDFMDTLKALAAEHGMSLPDRGRGQERFRAQHDLLEKAGEFFRGQLKGSPDAMAYLAERGLEGDILDSFEIGYAPDEWRSLDGLAADDSARRILLELGLLKRHERKNNVYAFFRGRIMFPIRNEFGKMVGFGGRTIIGDDAKYINSPESRLFEKGRLLYGLHRALPAAKEEGVLIVVEGYTDVMSLARQGIGFAAAPMGTALTERQVEVMLRYADKLVLCFDGDEAGRRAAERSLESIIGGLKDGKGASFLFLPPGEDPDSFVRENGKETFLKKVEEAKPLGEFMLETVGGDLREGSDEVKKVEFLSEVTRYIEKIDPNKAPFLRETLYEVLAQKVGMTSERLQSAARTAKRSREHRQDRRAPAINEDGIFYRLLACLNLRPDLVHQVSDVPILGNPEEVGLFHEAYQWLLEQDRPEINLLAQYFEEKGQVRLARRLKDNTRNWRKDMNAEETFNEIAKKFKDLATKEAVKRKTLDKLNEAARPDA